MNLSSYDSYDLQGHADKLHQVLHAHAVRTADCRMRHPAGFTLIEIIMVVGILTLLISLIGGMANQVIESNHLTIAGEMVIRELHRARHTALTQNRVTEVRFFEDKAYSEKTGGRSGLNALQCFVYDNRNVSSQPTQPVCHLPNGVLLHTEGALSSLLSQDRLTNNFRFDESLSNSTRGPSVGNRTGFSDQSKLIPKGQSLKSSSMTFASLRQEAEKSWVSQDLANASHDTRVYRIRFLPDGSTDLDPGIQWFMTLYLSFDAAVIPQNFVTIQIDPSHGTTRIFRP